MAGHTEARRLVNELRALGWEVEATKAGKWKAVPPRKTPGCWSAVYLPMTPSDQRWRRNAVTQIRRADPKCPLTARGS